MQLRSTNHTKRQEQNPFADHPRLFDAVGFGQWLRYVTGAIEVGSAIALWLPGLQAYAAGLLVCTMIGALIAHALVLGLAAGLPAVVLGALAATTLWAYRAQLSR